MYASWRVLASISLNVVFNWILFLNFDSWIKLYVFVLHFFFVHFFRKNVYRNKRSLPQERHIPVGVIVFHLNNNNTHRPVFAVRLSSVHHKPPASCFFQAAALLTVDLKTLLAWNEVLNKYGLVETQDKILLSNGSSHIFCTRPVRWRTHTRAFASWRTSGSPRSLPPPPPFRPSAVKWMFWWKIRCQEGTQTRLKHDISLKRDLKRATPGKETRFRCTVRLFCRGSILPHVRFLRRWSPASVVWWRTTSSRKVTWRRWSAAAAFVRTREVGRRTRWSTATDTAATLLCTKVSGAEPSSGELARSL